MANTPGTTYILSPQIKAKIAALKELDCLPTNTAVIINLVNKEYRERKQELAAEGIKAERIPKI